MLIDEKIDKLIFEIEKQLREIRNLFHNEEKNMQDATYKKLWDSIVENANKLHLLVNPKYSENMIKNRRCNPNNPEFYCNLAAIEDLLVYSLTKN